MLKRIILRPVEQPLPGIPPPAPAGGRPMPQSEPELLQGALDLLILKSLALEKMHGMGISRRIAQINNGAFEVKAGSLFPALYRMEQAGWLVSSWGESETKHRSKFYRLTNGGRKRLQTESERWERISLAMASALRAT